MNQARAPSANSQNSEAEALVENVASEGEESKLIQQQEEEENVRKEAEQKQEQEEELRRQEEQRVAEEHRMQEEHRQAEHKRLQVGWLHRGEQLHSRVSLGFILIVAHFDWV